MIINTNNEQAINELAVVAEHITRILPEWANEAARLTPPWAGASSPLVKVLQVYIHALQNGYVLESVNDYQGYLIIIGNKI